MLGQFDGKPWSTYYKTGAAAEDYNHSTNVGLLYVNQINQPISVSHFNSNCLVDSV